MNFMILMNIIAKYNVHVAEENEIGVISVTS